MMGYAVELYLDGPTSEDVRAIWASIESAGLSGFMPTSGARPHVSLAVYSHVVPSEIKPILPSFSSEVGETKIEFEGVSTFPIGGGAVPTGGGVVFLAPKLTNSLRTLHSRFHTLARPFASGLSDYYAPGVWVPHCTLDMDLPAENVSKIMELCGEHDLPTEARLVEIGLVGFRPIKELMNFPLRRME